MPELRRLLVADDPEAWIAAGFAVSDNGTGGTETVIGSIAVRFVNGPGEPPKTGILGWELTEIGDGSIDGIMSIGTESPPSTAMEHPNKVSRMDHVVIMTPDLERTTASLRGFGFSPRRTRAIPGSEPPRSQIFFWAGETIFEVVGPVEATGSAPARVWGFALTTDDMDAAAAAIGTNLGTAKPAVQPGRHIATVDTATLGITTAIALMTPHITTSDSAED